MNFLGRNIANIIENISIDRLSSYKYSDSDSTDLILSRYIFNVQISESFYPVIAALEISLRNRVFHHEIIINNKNGIENCYEQTKKVLYSLSKDYAEIFENTFRFEDIIKQKP